MVVTVVVVNGSGFFMLGKKSSTTAVPGIQQGGKHPARFLRSYLKPQTYHAADSKSLSVVWIGHSGGVFLVACVCVCVFVSTLHLAGGVRLWRDQAGTAGTVGQDRPRRPRWGFRSYCGQVAVRGLNEVITPSELLHPIFFMTDHMERKDSAVNSYNRKYTGTK